MKNIVYIFCDELRQDALRCYGNPAGEMRTPNIDEIARQGVLFENCFCNSPICVPSRVSLMTGLYPEDTAVYGNEAVYPTFKLNENFITFPQVLAGAGYRTANFGKTHLPVQMRPFQLDNQAGSEMTYGLTREEIRNLKKVIPKGDFSFNAASLYPKEKEYYPEVVTSNALKWIDEQTEPFFVRLSYTQPHSPIIVKNGYELVYKDYDFDGKLPDIMSLSQFEQAFAGIVALDTLTEEEIRMAKVYYYGLVAWIDGEVGKVLRHLKERGLIENTVLIIGADHGALRGESRGLGKHIFNRAAQAVPLIVSDPGNTPQGVRNKELCSNIDFAKTLFALLNIPAPGQFKGRDLFSEETPSEVYATIGYGENDSCLFPNRKLGFLPDGRGWPRRSCIRTQRYRLDMNIKINGDFVSPDGEDIFFVDCDACPAEDRNMVNMPEHRRTVLELTAKLQNHCRRSNEAAHGMLNVPDSAVAAAMQ